MSALNKFMTRAFTDNFWPKATSAGRSARIATPRTRSRRLNGPFQRWPATIVAANATRIGSSIIATPITAKRWRWASPTSRPDVAACYDCHGHHDVLPRSNPASHLSKANILGTCQQVPLRRHGQSFTQYKPHANPLDGRIILPLHAVFLGMTGSADRRVRVLWRAYRRSGCSGPVIFMCTIRRLSAKPRSTRKADDEWFTRFVPFERFLHFLVVTSFLLLVVTGMPLEVLLHRLGQNPFQLARRHGNGARAASFWSDHHVPVFRPCTSASLIGKRLGRTRVHCATQSNGKFQLKRRLEVLCSDRTR